ncbi:type VII secretion target [Mycolicibacterium mengxianglii]|uniref:type VII secretion target n=1 Tax=Mycolicibacterium mengxianglii TaxID=2736649 RepID=UPI0018EEEB7F|nr:type VII secretion target [Mycolicibacterium mengxianglii]
MSLLNVEAAGLQELAATCSTWSAELESTATPSPYGPACQATAAAVNAAHAAAEAAAHMLAERMRSTSVRLHETAQQFASHEDTASASFGQLTRRA